MEVYNAPGRRKIIQRTECCSNRNEGSGDLTPRVAEVLGGLENDLRVPFSDRFQNMLCFRFPYLSAKTVGFSTISENEA